METQAQTPLKMGPIQFGSIQAVDLVKLDPSIPYLIVIKEDARDSDIEALISAMSRAGVFATIVRGDPRNFRIYASFSWHVGPQNFDGEKAEKPAKRISKKAQSTKAQSTEELLQKVDDVLLQYMKPDEVQSATFTPLRNLCGQYSVWSTSVATEVLRLQNANVLADGVLTALRRLQPEPKAKKPRATKK